jgi:hypothetical protein
MRRFSRGGVLLVGYELGDFPRLERERLARKPTDDPSTKPSAATTAMSQSKSSSSSRLEGLLCTTAESCGLAHPRACDT